MRISVVKLDGIQIVVTISMGLSLQFLNIYLAEIVIFSLDNLQKIKGYLYLW